MDTRDRPVILDDVARVSGVSRATASRALSGKPGVANDVRARVHATAKALDYRPNRAARNLAGAKTSLIALLLGGSRVYRNPYTASLVDAMAKAAEEFDQGLVLVMSGNEPGQAVNNLIHDRIVDGVVISAPTFGEAWAEHLMDSDMPAVLIGQHPRRTDTPAVQLENKQAAEQLVGHLLDTGCRRVGMITGPGGRRDADDRLEGFEAAHVARGVRLDPALVVSGNFERQDGVAGASYLLDKGVDGIFAASDMMAGCVLVTCDEQGVDVPGEVSVVGFDGASELGLSRHDLTTFVQPFDALARRSIELLLDPSTPNPILTGHAHYGTTTRPLVDGAGVSS